MKKAFTLIELIAVLVVLAILALIVTPLVMNIIRKARISADKRSIDAYGKSVEIAIASYLLDEGKFPKDISELKIEYSGNSVNCETIQMNPDSTVYLEKCKINGKVVDYTYGIDKIIKYKKYQVGDCEADGTYVNYKNQKWCVVKDSSIYDDYVTLIKEIPLSEHETSGMTGYGAIRTTESGKYGYDVYIRQHWFYTSLECGFQTPWQPETINETNCINDYNQSHIKQKVDLYAQRLDLDNLKEVEGYKIRLITKEELENLGIVDGRFTEETIPWVKIGPSYWTMTKEEGSNKKVYVVDLYYGVIPVTVYGDTYAYRYAYTRPVINLYKNAIEE